MKETRVPFMVGAAILSAAASLAAPNALTFNSSRLACDAGLHVRPASQELLEHAQSSIERIQSRTERLANRAAKADELKGKSDSLRKEIVELYRMIHSVELTADELLLRGERDGQLLRERAGQLIGPLDDAVTALRPHLGSTPGLINAATRRAKEQLGPIKQLDELMKQRKWTAAHQKLEDLLEAADEVGRFPDRSEIETLFRPLQERLAQVRAGYLMEKKPTVLPALREEFNQSRPDVEQLRKRLASISDSVRDMRELRWNDQPISGPDMLGQIADTWLATDEAVLKAAAVLHAIGPTAETDVRSLQSDYEAARVQAVTLVRDLILADVRSSAPAAAEQRYVAYLAVIPGFMTALHATPDNALAATAALNQLAGKSPELESKVRAYRAATAEAFRWRRRIAARYLQKFHEQSPSEQLAALIDHPPARAGEPSGPPVLPGQQPPPTQRRMTQMAWTIDQAPDSVATLWTEHWKGTPARHSSLAVRWSPTGDPIFISSWHSRVVAEIECSRQTLLDCIGRLTKDLLLASNHPPITLEAAIALHTAVHGPYAELGGRLRGAVVENLPDRLFDMHDSGDVVGALAPGTLAAYPTMPALIRLQFEPDWFMHDLFAEFTGTPPATAEPAPPSAPPQSPPVASQVSPPKAPTAPGAAPPLPPGTSSPPSVSAPESTSAGASNAPKATIKKEPATKPPEGGFRF